MAQQPAPLRVEMQFSGLQFNFHGPLPDLILSFGNAYDDNAIPDAWQFDSGTPPLHQMCWARLYQSWHGWRTKWNRQATPPILRILPNGDLIDDTCAHPNGMNFPLAKIL